MATPEVTPANHCYEQGELDDQSLKTEIGHGRMSIMSLD